MYAIVVDSGSFCWWQIYYKNGKIAAVGLNCSTKSNAKRSLRNFLNRIHVRFKKAKIKSNWPKEQFVLTERR